MDAEQTALNIRGRAWVAKQAGCRLRFGTLGYKDSLSEKRSPSVL